MVKLKQQKPYDITKSGPLGYRQLQQANRNALDGIDLTPTDENFIKRRNAYTAYRGNSLYNAAEAAPQEVQSPLYNQHTKLGESMFDEDAYNQDQFEHAGDVRANNQPWYSQLMAGIGKGAVQATTAFVDGTAGLVLGVGEGIAGAIRGDSATDNWSKLFHNEISDAMAQINKSMEDIMPNYYSEEELNNPWYKNLGTMNFWADGLIKNMGFTVAAVYTGNVWNAAFKAAGLLKSGATIGAKVMGSLMSAVNEGRMEANNNSTDLLNLRTAEINDAAVKRNQELDAKFKAKQQQLMGSDMSNNQKRANMLLLQEQYNKEKGQLEATHKQLLKDAQDKANMAGIMDLAINIPILAMNDFMTYGRIYANSFKGIQQEAGKKGVGSLIEQVNRKASETLAKEESPLLKRIIKNKDGSYLWDEIKKRDNWLNAGKIAAREGNEEMAQQFAANFSGEYYSPDSPKAYYEAMRNNNSNIKTQDALSSMVKGFATSYGDGSQWEQFAIGAINGLIGVPTFGKVTNSTENTWLGRNKWIGISGGAIGEARSNSAVNQRGDVLVNNMNKLRNEIQDKKKLMAQSMSFVNAMSGFSDSNNKFEYQNHADNDTFNLFTSYLLAGKEDDLKELINQNFANFTDEQLEDIKGICGFTREEWLDKDGNLTEDGKNQMRNKLEERKKSMLEQFDSYKKALSVIRNTSDIPEEHQNELAWLLWKGGRFTSRIKEILNKPENKTALKSVVEGINNYTTALRNEQAGLKGTETRKDKDGKEINLLKENQKLVEQWDKIQSFMTALMKGDSNTIAALSLKENQNFLNDLLTKDFYYTLADHTSNMGYLNYMETMKNLKDAGKLASAYKTFDEKLREYTKNPSKIDKDHKKVDEQEEANNEVKTKTKAVDKAANSTPNDLIKESMDGSIDLDEIDDIIDGMSEEEESSEKSNEGNPTVEKAKENVKNAKDIKASYTKALQELQKKLQRGEITQEEFDNAKSMLDASLEVSQNADELLDLDTEAYNDLENIPVTQDELNEWAKENPDATQEEVNEAAEALKQEKLDKAKGALSSVKESMRQSKEEEENFPDLEELNQLNEEDKKEEEEKRKKKEEQASRDGTTTTKTTEQQRKEEEKKKQKEEEKNKKKEAEIKDLEHAAYSIMEDAGFNPIERGDILTNLSMLLGLVDSIIKEGLKNGKADMASIIGGLKDSTAYKLVEKDIPNIMDYLNLYVPYKIKNIKEGIFNKSNEASTNESESPVIGTQDNQVPEGEIAYTPEITPNAVNNSINSSGVKNDSSPLWFWYPATTQYSRLEKRNARPYHEDSSLSKDLKARYKAIHDFLNNKHNAFENLRNLNKGSKVHLGYSKELNEKVGDMVLLILDENGNVVGDLPTRKDLRFKDIKGLKEAYDKAEGMAKNADPANTEDIVDIGIESEVNKKMVGRPNYTGINERNSLNAIFNGSPMTLGIAMSDGKTNLTIEPGKKKVAKSAREEATMSPLDARKGQPYVLIETSDKNRKFYPVPFTMPKLADNSLRNTKIYKAISEVLDKLKDVKSVKDIVGVKDDLQSLLVLPVLHINMTKEGNLKIDIQRPTDSHIYTIYNGKQDDPNMVEHILDNLKGQGGTSIQVSRNYINSKFYGYDYNEMIGEIAETNLPVGGTHTVNDWFTINPIVEGKQEKAKNPKSINTNPAKEDRNNFFVTNPNNGKEYHINLSSNKVYETLSNGAYKDITNISPTLNAYLWCMAHSLSHGVKNTPFGYYNIDSAKMEKPPITNETSQKIMKYAGYYEGGGRLLSDDYPNAKNMPKELEDKVDNWITRGHYLSEEDAQKYLSYLDINEPVTLESPISPNAADEKFSISNEKGIMTNTGPTVQSEETVAYYGKNNNDGTITVTPSNFNRAKQLQNLNTVYTLRGDRENATKMVILKPAIVKARGNNLFEVVSKGEITWIHEENGESSSTPTGQSNTTEDTIKNIKDKIKIKLSINIEKVFNNLDSETLDKINKMSSNLLSIKLKKVESLIDFNMSMNKQVSKLKEILGMKTLNREENKGVEHKKWNQKKEESRVFKMLPQLGREGAVTIVESIKNMNGDTVIYGQFKNGAIYLMENAARGTLYHESFHYVTQSLLSKEELGDLYTLAKEKYGDLANIELEENMAEDFRRYMQKEEGFTGAFVRAWRKIKNIISSVFNNSRTVDKMFYDISRGNYANREVNKTSDKYSQDIGDYYKSKYSYSNLSLEQKDFLKEKGINIDTYNQMSSEEKEVLFRCF